MSEAMVKLIQMFGNKENAILVATDRLDDKNHCDETAGKPHT